MENNMDNLPTSRKVKTVRFNREDQVVFFETPKLESFGDIDLFTATVREPEEGSVRDRVRRYNQRASRRALAPQPRPPALPPRNVVPEASASEETTAPTPPPRVQNYSTVSLPKVRTYKRDPNARLVVERLTSRVMVVPVDVHHRMKVPDTPPPPPPTSAAPGPSAEAGPSTAPGPSAAPGPSGSSRPSGDYSAERSYRKESDPAQEQARGPTRAEDDDDQSTKTGCTAGCGLFFVGCFGCILG